MSQEELDTFNIPLVVRTIEPRKTIPSEIIKLCKEWSASHLFANLEYEIDELRRDIKLCELASEEGNLEFQFYHDYTILQPGTVTTKQDKPYSVFSPFHRMWSSILLEDLEGYSKEYALPAANDDAVRNDSTLSPLFSEEVPTSVPGFEIEDEEQKQRVQTLFPVGTDTAEEVRST